MFLKLWTTLTIFFCMIFLLVLVLLESTKILSTLTSIWLFMVFCLYKCAWKAMYECYKLWVIDGLKNLKYMSVIGLFEFCLVCNERNHINSICLMIIVKILSHFVTATLKKENRVEIIVLFVKFYCLKIVYKIDLKSLSSIIVWIYIKYSLL